MLTTRHQTQIVVSPDSDDEDRESKAYGAGSSASNLTRTATSPLGSATSHMGLGPGPGQDGGMSNPLSYRYPHTWSTLMAIIREYKPDGDVDDGLLRQAVGLLRDENEDGLKSLVKNNLDIGDDAVSRRPHCRASMALMYACKLLTNALPGGTVYPRSSAFSSR
jgi:hypothetical protein